MMNIEFNRLNDSVNYISETRRATGRIRIRFKTEKYGKINVLFEPPTELSYLDKPITEIDTKMSIISHTKDFTDSEKIYIEKYCVAVWILVNETENIINQSS